MEGPVRTVRNLTAAATDTTASVREDGSWYVVEGTIDPDFAERDTEVYVSVRNDSGVSTTYQAFRTSFRETDGDGWNDDGYQLYLRGTSIPEGTVHVDIIIVNGAVQTLAKTEEFR